MDSCCSPDKRSWFSWLCSLIQSPLLLLIRIIWGLLFIQAGFGKLADIGNVVEFFTSLNIPYPVFSAWLVAFVETIGGVLILIGFLTRFAAVPFVIVMVTALLTAHQEATMHLFTDFSEFMKQAPFTYLFATLTLMAFGPGCFSVDRCCTKKKSCDTESE